MMKALVVARWEYLEKLKSKAFLLSLLITPALMIAVGFLPAILADRGDQESKVVGVIDFGGTLYEQLGDRMGKYLLPDGQPNYVVRPIAIGSAVNPSVARKQADDMVLRGDIEAYCVLGGVADSVVELRSRNVGDFRLTSRLEDAVRALIAEKRLIERGLQPSLLAEIRKPVSVRTIKLTGDGEDEEAGWERVFFSAYVFLMMLFTLILTSGQMLVRSVMEEKSNRIVEVLVSSCSPTELMAGKVLGLSALGFTQIGFWTFVGFLASLVMGIELVPMSQVLLLVVYFILGYLFYAAVFIACGSPVTTEQEAQQITSYLVILLIIPIVLAFPAMQHPDALWLKILSFVPFLTPTMMALRIPIQTPSTVEILLTVVLMLFSIYVAMVAAGRIFRIAILATGKRPSLEEVLRWVRTG